MALSLNVIAAIGLLLSALALTDIYHNEADVTLEWNMIRVSFLFILLSITFSGITILKLGRN